MQSIFFRAFILAVSLAMIVAVYGVFAKDMSVTLFGVIFGLLSTVVGWVGFIKDVRHDAQVQAAQS